MRSWISSHRSLAATVTSSALVAALVATLALVSTGYTAQRMDLTDPSVWVLGGEHQAIGRANTQVFELDSVVEVEADDPRIVQSGTTVLLVDQASATVRDIDPATAVLGDDIALPPQRPELLLAGDRVAIVAQATGEVWLLPLADLGSFDAASPATLSLGENAVVTTTETGALLAYLPEVSQVWQVEPDAVEVGQRWDVAWGADAAVTDAVQLTAVGERWAVLDTATRELATASGVRPLTEALGGTGVRLQKPGPANARVLIAHSGGLIGADMMGGAPVAFVDDAAGIAAAPVVVGGCRYAAWSSGVGWRGCGSDAPERLALAQMPSNPTLRFATNGGHVALNDVAGGSSWAVQADGELIDNWDDLITDDDLQTEQPEADDETPPEFEELQKPPVAVDDTFGARPGRATVLPVLLND
ncbi:MAG TPA: fibronectin type III domain-containing protein, partial [Protaetiibacter sp.]|nr:fibronectin type III domain-containing protein [Protaetiibacter sp.]